MASVASTKASVQSKLSIASASAVGDEMAVRGELGERSIGLHRGATRELGGHDLGATSCADGPAPYGSVMADDLGRPRVTSHDLGDSGGGERVSLVLDERDHRISVAGAQPTAFSVPRPPAGLPPPPSSPGVQPPPPGPAPPVRVPFPGRRPFATPPPSPPPASLASQVKSAQPSPPPSPPSGGSIRRLSRAASSTLRRASDGDDRSDRASLVADNDDNEDERRDEHGEHEAGAPAATASMVRRLSAGALDVEAARRLSGVELSSLGEASGLRADAAHVKEADDPAALTFPEAAGPPRAVVDEVTPRHVVIDQSSPTSAHAHHPPLPLLPLHPATLDGPASAVENSIITRVDQVGATLHPTDGTLALTLSSSQLYYNDEIGIVETLVLGERGTLTHVEVLKVCSEGSCIGTLLRVGARDLRVTVRVGRYGVPRSALAPAPPNTTISSTATSSTSSTPDTSSQVKSSQVKGTKGGQYTVSVLSEVEEKPTTRCAKLRAWCRLQPLLMPWVLNMGLLTACTIYNLYGIFLILEAEALGAVTGFFDASCAAYALSCALSFFVKDPLMAAVIAALPTHETHRARIAARLSMDGGTEPSTARDAVEPRLNRDLSQLNTSQKRLDL